MPAFSSILLTETSAPPPLRIQFKSKESESFERVGFFWSAVEPIAHAQIQGIFVRVYLFFASFKTFCTFLHVRFIFSLEYNLEYNINNWK